MKLPKYGLRCLLINIKQHTQMKIQKENVLIIKQLLLLRNKLEKSINVL